MSELVAIFFIFIDTLKKKCYLCYACYPYSSNNFMNLWMGQVKEINIKTQTYFFFNDMINIEVFDSNLPKMDKTSYKNIDIYYTGYITI